MLRSNGLTAMHGLEDVNYYFRKAARAMGPSAHVERIVMTPFCEAQVDVSEAQGTASLMTGNTAAVNVPYEGAKGGLAVDPATLTPREQERLTRRFVQQIHDMIGPQRDIPAPDVNTNAQVMAWIMDEYSRMHGFSPAVVTGKPVDLFGSKGREEATGRGAGMALEEHLHDAGLGGGRG